MSLPIFQAGGPGEHPDRYHCALSTDPPGVRMVRRGPAGLFSRPTVRPLTDRRAAVRCRSHVVVADPALDLTPFSPLDAAGLVVEAATMLRRYPDDTTALLGREHAEALVLVDVTLNRLASDDADVRAQMWAVRGAVELIQEGLAVVRLYLGLGLPENPSHDNGLPVIAPEVPS